MVALYTLLGPIMQWLNRKLQLVRIPGIGVSLVGGAGVTGLEQPCSSCRVASNTCSAV